MEFRIETAGGATRIRLVHSGFGGDGSWDDMIDGLEAGWSYFLAHLRHCLERHPGVPRTLLKAQPQCSASVADGQAAILGASGLALEGMDGDLVAGRACSLRLGDERMEARVLVARLPRTAAFVIPALGDAVLFVERESLRTEFRLGIWLSVYGQDADRCRKWQGDVSALAERLSSALPVKEPPAETPPGAGVTPHGPAPFACRPLRVALPSAVDWLPSTSSSTSSCGRAPSLRPRS